MIIDLSHRIEDGMPVYPGDPVTSIKPDATFEKEGYWGNALALGTHAGTHIDAPAHMVEGGKTLGKIPVDRFIGRGVYIFVRDDVYTLDAVKEVDIQEGDIVLFHTSMSYKYYDKAYFDEYPAMTEEIAHYLVDKKVRMVGVDTCSIDNKEGFPIHKILLSNDIPVIEGLTNVEQLSGLESTIYALPLSLDLDAAPARVLADIR